MKQLLKPQIALNIGDNPTNSIIFRQTLWQPLRYSLLIVSPHTLTTLVGWGIRLPLKANSCIVGKPTHRCCRTVGWQKPTIPKQGRSALEFHFDLSPLHALGISESGFLVMAFGMIGVVMAIYEHQTLVLHARQGLDSIVVVERHALCLVCRTHGGYHRLILVDARRAECRL